MVEASANLADADDKVIKDAAIYNASTEEVDQASLEFMVRDPQNQSGTVLYKVCGRDKEGMFEGQRRYNEFFLLHEALVKRWPGIPVPTIPPKKSIGNKDLIFIQQRRFYLEKFFRSISKFGFLINSQEFRVFFQVPKVFSQKKPNLIPLKKDPR